MSIRPTALVISLALALTVSAQDPPTPTPPGDPATEPTFLDFQCRFLDIQFGKRQVTAAGNVEARLGDRLIRCENLVAWWRTDPRTPQPGEPGPVPDQVARWTGFVDEVYAEGHVIYRREGGEWVHCDRLYLDVQQERGLLVDATMSFPLSTRDGETSLALRADEVRILARNRVQATGIQTWIGPFGKPFTHVTSDRIEIIRESEDQMDPEGGEPNRIENYHVEGEGNVLRLGALPVLWLPDFVGDTASRRNSLLIEDVRFSNSSEFGRELGITIGDDIEIEDGTRWGHWSTHLDWYSKRGPGVGVDLVYETSDYRGTFYSRYQRDTGRDSNFGLPPDKDRGRLSWWHRHILPADVQLDLEFQLFSDRGFYPTYFEDQEKGLKPPENLIYLKKAFFNSMVTGLGSTRFNDWLTRVEQQPEIRYDLVTEPLFDILDHPLYFSVSARGGHARLEIDEDLDIPSQDTWRVDIDNLLEYAFLAGPLKVTPFAGIRYSYFEKDRFDRENRNRIGFLSGVTVTSQLWRDYDVLGGPFDLDGLRHLVLPEITFRNTTGVHIDSEDLIQIDDVEGFDDEQVVEFRLRNILQTVRHRDDGSAVDTFLDLEIEVPFYPNPRDNEGDPWGNLDVDLLVRFTDALQFISDFEVDWYGRGIEVANAAIGYAPSRDLQTYAGFRHFHDTYDAVFVQANWRIDEKWLVTAETSYDFDEGRGIDHRFVLTRIGPDWVFELGFDVDLGQDDFSIVVSLEPRFLFDPVLKPKSLRNEPRLLYLGSGVWK